MFSHRVTAAATEKPVPSARIRIWARPGSPRAEIRWDPWRERWTVAVPDRAVRGAANRALLGAVAERLGVAADTLRWVHAGTAAAKELEVVGLGAEEVERRLGAGVDRASDGPAGTPVR